jgi:hypothetical protein
MNTGMIIAMVFTTLLSVFQSEPLPLNGNTISFGPGEVITYKIHYGFINAAEAEMTISDELYKVNGVPCFKINIFGQSTGMFDVFAKIRDNWGTYLDTSTLRPTRFYRKLKEGKHRHNEYVNFDYKKGIAETNEYSYSNERWMPVVSHEIPKDLQDIVSGYYYIRTLDFNELKAGDMIVLDAFFDKKLYNFKIRVLGREMVKTRLGKIRSIVFAPIMPENSLFDGENSIKIWLSDDINKVPLKVKASMFVGAVEIDIESFKKGKVK